METNSPAQASGPMHQFLRAQIFSDLLSTFDNSNADGMTAAAECAEAVFILTSWARTQFVGSVLTTCLKRGREMRHAVTRISATWRGFLKRRNLKFGRIRTNFLDEVKRPPLSLELSEATSVADIVWFVPEVIVDMYKDQRGDYIRALVNCRGSSAAWESFPPFRFEVPLDQLLTGCRQRHAQLGSPPDSSVSLPMVFQSATHGQSSSDEAVSSSMDPPLVFTDFMSAGSSTPLLSLCHLEDMWTNDVRAMELRRRHFGPFSEREGQMSSRSAFAEASAVRSPRADECRSDLALRADSEPSRSRSRSIDVMESCLTIPVAAVHPAEDVSREREDGGILSLNSATGDETSLAPERAAEAIRDTDDAPKAVPTLLEQSTPAQGENLVQEKGELSPVSPGPGGSGPDATLQTSSSTRKPMRGYSKRHMMIRPFSRPLPPRSSSPPMFPDKVDLTIATSHKNADTSPQRETTVSKNNRTKEIFDILESAKTPAMREILSSVDGSVILQGRIRALQKLLRGTRRKNSPKPRSSSPTGSSSGEDDQDGVKFSRPGSAQETSDLISHQSPVPRTVPSRALTPSLIRGAPGATSVHPHPSSTAAMFVPPCMRRCLTPVERTPAPTMTVPETRISIPRFKKAADTLSPADVCRLRQEREKAKEVASFERGSNVAYRIRTAIGSRYSHDDERSHQTIGKGERVAGGALGETLKSRAARGHSIDLSLLPTAVGAEIRLATQAELKLLREVQVRLGRN